MRPNMELDIGMNHLPERRIVYAGSSGAPLHCIQTALRL
jgi:hypothetical protein